MKINFISLSKNFPDNTKDAYFTVTIQIDAEAKKATYYIKRGGYSSPTFWGDSVKSFPDSREEYLYSQTNLIHCLKEGLIKQLENALDFIGQTEQRALGFIK